MKFWECDFSTLPFATLPRGFRGTVMQPHAIHVQRPADPLGPRGGLIRGEDREKVSARGAHLVEP